MNNLLSRFLGRHEKRQQQKSQSLIDFSDKKMKEYRKEMAGIKKMAKSAHRVALKNVQNAQELLDITQKLAIVVDKRGIVKT